MRFGEHWVLEEGTAFLNHGSFGATPRAVLEVQSELRARMEAEPVRFFVRELQGLFDDATAMLDEMEGWLEPVGLCGTWPANRSDDDITLWTDEGRGTARALLHTLRQQSARSGGRPNRALADFVAPTGTPDWIGGFMVTTGTGVAARATAFEAEHDDYSSILLKSLADRLAEAMAEWTHAKVRQELWGHAADEALSLSDIIGEAYEGIRPAPGYPACPDHTTKPLLFELLGATDLTGATLTESMAIDPAASVAGWIFAHPESGYFGVGKIGVDQLEDYATRRGWTLDEARRWLGSNLAD
jgi:5-methyltetrahydrofolate--homocysteine methyltransferase